MLLVNPRLLPIATLAHDADVAVNLDELSRRESDARALFDKGVLPSIGCEIEVTWSSIYPEVADEFFGPADRLGRRPIRYSDLDEDQQRKFNSFCDHYDAINVPRYQRTHDAGIPKGEDAYWEFAHNPTYDHRTLSEEVELLYRERLIPEDAEHSLHVTLGNIANKGAGASFILSGLELLHVSPQRVQSAIRPSRYGTNMSWARRGKDGIRERPARDLSLGSSVAVEMRSLTANSSEHTAEVLRTAQMLGSILLTYRKQDASMPIGIESIRELWPEFRDSLKQLWTARGLPSSSWGTPQYNRSRWVTWAQCLADRDQAGTLERQTVDTIKKIVDEVESVVRSI
ncbi:MAG: hypothetical protein QG628_570 [Patescibacteria group bacterium]|nr:hypothetical protein [Patescibacteria group bacterium]